MKHQTRGKLGAGPLFWTTRFPHSRCSWGSTPTDHYIKSITESYNLNRSKGSLWRSTQILHELLDCEGSHDDKITMSQNRFNSFTSIEKWCQAIADGTHESSQCLGRAIPRGHLGESPHRGEGRSYNGVQNAEGHVGFTASQQNEGDCWNT